MVRTLFALDISFEESEVIQYLCLLSLSMIDN